MGLQKYRADITGEPQANGAVPCFTKWMGGPSLALVRNCPVQNREGMSPRTVYVRGEPDTYFSVPAACSWHGQTLQGFLTCNDDGCYVFHAYSEAASATESAYTTCDVRFIHKIAPRDSDTSGPINLPNGCFANRNLLGKALRLAGMLHSGDRLREFRVEGNKVLCFPIGSCMIWHCITLTCREQSTHVIPKFSKMSRSELMAFWNKYSRHNRYRAAALLGNAAGAVKIASTLANYASNLATAMGCAERNDPTSEACYRHSCALCLARLPADIQAYIQS